MRKRVTLWAAGAAFFLLAFCVFSYWLFPYDMARDAIVREVEMPLRNGRRAPSGYALDIGSLRPSFFNGVALEDVRFARLGERPDDASKIELALTEATVRVSPLALLFGDFDVSLSSSAGDIDAAFEQGDGASFALSFESFDFARAGLRVFGLPLTGKLDGTVAVDAPAREVPTNVPVGAPETNWPKSQGRVALSLDGLTVGDGKAKAKLPGFSDGMTIESLRAGDVTANATIRDGVMTIDELKGDGQDLELAGSGDLRLGRVFEASRLNLLLSVKITDAYRNRNDRTRGLFSALDFNPTIRAARTPAGALQYQLTGTLSGGVEARAAGRATPPRTARGGS